MTADRGRAVLLAAWRDPEVLLVTGIGSGLARVAPGTWGSAAALAFWWLLLAEAGPVVQLAVIAITVLVGTWLTARVCRRYGVGDAPAIVVDEFAGLWLALVAAPPGPVWLLAGFALFRLFDIWKPFPVGLADRRVKGAFGIMLDDLLAGLLAAGVLQLSFRVLDGPLLPPG
ncbi:MAG: phosphatidylglycerophosphatase A [Pseudomonadales bacterium]